MARRNASTATVVEQDPSLVRSLKDSSLKGFGYRLVKTTPASFVSDTVTVVEGTVYDVGRLGKVVAKGGKAVGSTVAVVARPSKFSDARNRRLAKRLEKLAQDPEAAAKLTQIVTDAARSTADSGTPAGS